MKAPRWMVAVAGCCLLTVNALAAEPFPAKPIRLVVPFGAGGITDNIARLVGQEWSGALGQTVLIENRPGAGGLIAAQAAAKAAPDGYTVFMGTVGTQIVNPLIYPAGKLPYSPDSQFTPLGMVSKSPFMLAVAASVPARDLKEFLAYARSHPERLDYGSAGSASAPHMSMELFKLLSGTKINHVPYKSGAEAVNAAIGGHVAAVIDAVPVVMPQVKAGKLRALAIANGTRSSAAPTVPTSQEAGLPSFETSSWNALYVPAGTPPAVVDKLATTLRTTLAHPGLRGRLAAQGSEALAGTQQEYAAMMAAEKKKWAAVVEAAKIKAE